MGDGADYLASCGIDQWSDVDYGYDQRVAEDIAMESISPLDYDKKRRLFRICDVFAGPAPHTEKASPGRVFVLVHGDSVCSCHDDMGYWVEWIEIREGKIVRGWSRNKRGVFYQHQVKRAFRPDMDNVTWIEWDPTKRSGGRITKR